MRLWKGSTRRPPEREAAQWKSGRRILSSMRWLFALSWLGDDAPHVGCGTPDVDGPVCVSHCKAAARRSGQNQRYSRSRGNGKGSAGTAIGYPKVRICSPRPASLRGNRYRRCGSGCLNVIFVVSCINKRCIGSQSNSSAWQVIDASCGKRSCRH